MKNFLRKTENIAVMSIYEYIIDFEVFMLHTENMCTGT